MSERIRKDFTPFQKGDKVWLEATNLKIAYPSRKLAPKQEGPFTISEVLGPLTYRLKLPHQWKIHDMFHATLLTPAKETQAHGPNFPQPPPDLIEGDEHFEVEAIIQHKTYRGKHRYLVKWKGYASADNTWEPEAHLTKTAGELLEEYKKKKKLR